MYSAINDIMIAFVIWCRTSGANFEGLEANTTSNIALGQYAIYGPKAHKLLLALFALIPSKSALNVLHHIAIATIISLEKQYIFNQYSARI